MGDEKESHHKSRLKHYRANDAAKAIQLSQRGKRKALRPPAAKEGQRSVVIQRKSIDKKVRRICLFITTPENFVIMCSVGGPTALLTTLLAEGCFGAEVRMRMRAWAQ